MWQAYQNGHPEHQGSSSSSSTYTSALSACAGSGQEELRTCTYDMAGSVVNQLKKIRTKQVVSNVVFKVQ